MEPFTTHTGVGVPLRRSNVDTDQIIPAVYLKRVTRTGFEDGLFAAWRDDPDFVLNQSGFAGRQRAGRGPRLRHRLLPRARGVGAAGLRLPGRAVLAVRRHLPRQRRQAGTARRAGRPGTTSSCIWKILENAPGTPVTVDLGARTVTCDEVVAPLQVDDYTRWRLMEGLDDVGLTLRHADAVDAFEAARPSWLPATQPAR